MGNTFYFDWEVTLMEWLQQFLGTVGVYLGSFFTMFGEELALTAILGFLYWCYDKEYGKYIGTNMVVGIVWNPLIKNVFLRRRPYFDNPTIKCLKPVHSDADIMDIAAQGFSFPSGHAMNSAIMYGSMAKYKKGNKILMALAVILPLLIGLSRVIVGVHYPTDVLVGWGVGVIVLFLVSYLQKKIKKMWVLHLIIFVTSLAGMFYCKTNDYYTAMGIMGGFFLADAFERKFVNFENTKVIWRCILRFAGGIGTFLLMNFLLELPFPDSILDSATTLQFVIRFFRYAIDAFFALGLFPMLFNKIEKGKFIVRADEVGEKAEKTTGTIAENA
ncbi:MAG: phosphatase PAP2 family protein [Eubacterium sp.]|nr:phosphatase PAP2 family protein [Eubacterium sp.]